MSLYKHVYQDVKQITGNIYNILFISGGFDMFLLDAATSTGAGASGWGIMIIYLVVIIGMMYFMAIRPQKKQQKKHDELMAALATGDYVLTSSGMYGTVIDITDDMVIIEFGNNKNCRIPMQKSAIVEVEKAQ